MEGILKLTSKQLSYLSKAINAERFGQEEVNNTSRNTLTAQEHDELNESISRLLCIVKEQPVERIPEETKSQSGEREEVCSICGGLLDSDSYAYGGKYPVHITCFLNARKIYIGSKDKKGKLKPSEYLKDLLSESREEGRRDALYKLSPLV
jgi:hypothetical protein